MHKKAAPKIVKLPIKTEKEKDTKAPLSVVDQQPPQGIVMPPGVLVPTIDMPPSVRPPAKPQMSAVQLQVQTWNQIQMWDIEENSPHLEGITTETYVVPDQSYLEQPQELIKLVNASKVVQKYLLQQADIDKILNIIKRKVLKGMHLPLTIKETQAGYLASSF